MKFSQSVIKTAREVSKDVESTNGQLLIRGSFIDQLMAGVYTFLPLGLRVINKIEGIVREEMEKAGGQEIRMPALNPKENWEKTGRWEAMDDLFRFTSYYTKTDLAIAPTHEEVISPLMKRFVFSYRDLPKYPFQIQTKFRDEKRAKGGLLRGREFLMKDLYSFHRDEKDLDEYYDKMKSHYANIYNRLGIGGNTYLTFASGGTFSKFSHEFQTVADSGEDTIYLCEKCQVAVNKEIIEEQEVCPECGSNIKKELKAIEVGNIFKLGTKYSKPFELVYSDEKGQEKEVVMGCYGIGISRLMGVVVEVCHDEKGILWPKEIAPYQVHLIDLDGKKQEAEKIYKELTMAGVEVLWDDRDETAGVKLADADLIGIPTRVVISARTLKAGEAEVKERSAKDFRLVNLNELKKELVK